MLVAHISDFHVVPPPELYYGRLDTRLSLARALERIESVSPRPDLVVGTGDLVDKPSAGAYAALRSVLAGLTIPLRLIPGNHDDRGLLAEAFPDHPYLGGDLVNFTADYEAFRLVAFDAVVAGKEYARPTPEALAWLEGALAAEPRRPVMLVMHHPPIDTRMDFVDAFQGGWSPEFLALIRANPQVRLILCGHAHRPIDAVVGAARVSAAGSTAHQFILSTDFATPPRMVFEPPMLRLHYWRDGEVVSHLIPVEAGHDTLMFKGVDETTWPATAERLKARLQRSQDGV